MDRSITPEEAAVIQWLLDHAAMRDMSAYRAHPTSELHVVGDRCESKILADAVAVYPGDQRAGLILWGRDAEIVSLEVYDLHPGASHRLPEIANLRTWEELGT